MSDSVTFADRLSAIDPSDERSGAGRTGERLFPFVDVAITMPSPLGETAGERHGIRAHAASCDAKDAEGRAVCRPSVNAWQ